MVDVMLNYDSGLHPYYGLLNLAEKYNIVKKVSTRYEFPDGSKAYEKSVYKEPEKYFTEDIMKQLEDVASKEFMYGSEEVSEEISID